MADIRINALATTAASTASDDFLAVDGSANGTRKLNAYSPTFGGNLTVSGTGVSTFGTTGKTAIQQFAGSGALVAGGWLYGVDEGLNFAPNGAGLNKKLVMAHWDGSAYRSVLEYSNVSSGTATLKLSDYGGLTTIGGNLGIGTTSPNKSSFSTAVTVNGATNSGFEVAVGDTRIAGFYAASSIAVLNAFANVPLAFSTNNTTQMQLFANGNLFVGASPTDGGQKLQVSGTGYLSDSLRVGTSFTPTAWGVKAIEVNDAGGGLFAAYYGGAPKGYMLGLSNGLRFNGHSSSSRIDIMDAGSIIVATSNTTALTLDSSQNATFAGRIGLTASGTNPIYSNFIPAAANTYAGLITMQAGGGSASYGGGLQLYGHSHATKPGWVSANISAGSSGKFAVNDSGLGGGTDVFTVDTTGNATLAGFVGIKDGMTAPSATSGTAKIYVDTADGDLKVIFGDGTVKTIVTD